MSIVLLSHDEWNDVPAGVELFSSQLNQVYDDLITVNWNQAKKAGCRSLSFPPLREPLIAKSLCDYLKKRMAELKPEAVISNGLMGWPLNEKELGCKLVMQYHGGWAPYADNAIPRDSLEYYRTRYAYAYFESLCGKKSSARASNSDYTKSMVQRYYHQTTKTIPLGIDLESFPEQSRKKARKRLGWSEEETIALFVGRPHYTKGFDIVESVASKNPETRFVCITFPKAESAQPNVQCLESVPRQQLSAYYSAADVVLNPTRFEGFGYVSLEALACNTPLIATKTGALSNESPPNARLVQKPGAESFHQAFREFLKDSTIEKSRNWVRQHYSFNQTIQQYQEWRNNGFSMKPND